MLNRRTFVKTLSAGVAATLVLPAKLMASLSGKIIGIQLYTLHAQMKKDALGTMSQVAKIGFNAVETAGYADRKFYGYEPKEFKTIVEDMGMTPQSSHAGITMMNIDETIEDTIAAGMSYLVLPSLDKSRRNTTDDYRKAADEFNIMGEKCRNAGLMFAYHNHAFEFVKLGDRIPYEILLENTVPELVAMQLDLYWIVYGGGDPVDYFHKYPGRFELFHVKDMAEGAGRESTEIGSGIIDFEAIFAEKDEAGMKFFYLEQESFNIDPFKSIAVSYNYLKTLKD